MFLIGIVVVFSPTFLEFVMVWKMFVRGENFVWSGFFRVILTDRL